MKTITQPGCQARRGSVAGWKAALVVMMALQIGTHVLPAQKTAASERQISYEEIKARWGNLPLPEVKAAAEKGDATAMHYLGRSCQEGGLAAQDYREALKWYRQAAEQGFPNSENNLGYMYSKGLGVPQDSGEALKWFERAAEHGFLIAQVQAADQYHAGEGVPKDPVKALKWYRIAAEAGHAGAQNMVGWAYEHGTEVPRSHQEAMKWIKRSADQGHVRGLLSMGFLLKEGTTDAGRREENYVEAAEWLAKAAEKREGGVSAEAAFHLGEIYYYGKIRHDYPEALKWFQLGATLGNTRAAARMADVYLGHFEGVPRNPAEAEKWARMAAEKNDAEGAYLLGLVYEEGGTSPKDPRKAMEWFRRAADLGHPQAAMELVKKGGSAVSSRESMAFLEQALAQGNTPAALELGKRHEAGNGTPKDLGAAVEMYRLAVESGWGDREGEALEALLGLYVSDARLFEAGETEESLEFKLKNKGTVRSSFLAGEIYQQGKLVKRNPTKAAQFYALAATQNYPPAQLRIGEMWAAGETGVANHAEAAKWYRSAANGGLAEAQFKLAQCYLKGEGVTKSETTAYAWLQIANTPEAVEARARLEKDLAPASRAQAESLVQPLLKRIAETKRGKTW